MRLLLGIDLGTSYFKVGLFDEAGELKGLGRVAIVKSAPAPGWCELPTDEFWRALRTGFGQALRQADAVPADVAGVAYSSQASTFLLLDGHDEPLTPLIVWTDARGTVPPDLAAFSRSDEFRTTTGFEGLSAQSAPTKWRWLQENASTTWRRARRIITVAEYFTFALTGERVVDTSSVAFLGAYDLLRGRWWPEALRRYGVDPAALSLPLRPGAPCGRTGARAAELVGLPSGIPFAVGALDHHAAAIGSGLERIADLSISTGTVLAALALVDIPAPREGCYHGCHVDGRRFWRLAFDTRGAGQLDDYQRQAAPGETIERLLALAADAPAGAAWRKPPSITHGSAVRAILERVAATHRELVDTVVGAERSGIRRIVATGGGARSPLWLQISADILGVPIVTPECVERACLGAAAFAAVAAGSYTTITEATSVMVRPDRTYEPDANSAARYREWLG